jgi:Zn-dependent M28 family amino/carboxypeptidase
MRRATVRLLATLLCGAALNACSRQQEPADADRQTTSPFSAAAESAAAAIEADDLRTSISTLASDEFEGRAPASRGDRAARSYLVDRLQKLGYSAGPNGKWEQPFDIVGVTAKMPARWVFTRGTDVLSLKWWDQYIATSGVQTPRVSIANAQLVFVGYGIQAPEYQWDDFKGLDLKGKILLMLNNDPDWDPALFAGRTRLYYGRWDYKYDIAARQGAAGAIIIHTQPSAGYPFQTVQTSWSGEQFELPAGDEARTLVRGWVSEAAARSLVAFGGQNLDRLVAAAKTRDFRPVQLGVTTSLAFDNRITRAQTANVYGVLPGSDPSLRDEAVVYTAHYDHLGIGTADKTGDKVYNGALDNGAGVAQLLAIAAAFKSLPVRPRRSVLFLFAAAEEAGLLGSQYFVEHPTFPANRIAANINYDGGNVWGRTRDVTFIGKGKSTLDAVVAQMARRQGRRVEADQFPDRGYFYRSDQFSFAKAGVPAVFLDMGTDFIGRPAGWGKEQVERYENNDYHQPSDEIRPDWTFDGMLEDARLGFWVGLTVASADEMPRWNPNDEFEAARRTALSSPSK